ncbi:MAG: hypothetical protein OXN84_19445 [Albidovulum sp.]|nr:hypothetical protein [Albidovulum sp.]
MRAGTYARRIPELPIADLPWSPSRMEGNAYSILEAERPVWFCGEASGKNREEALMILSHEKAIQYLADSLEDVAISRRDPVNIRANPSDGLFAGAALSGSLRRMPVGIAHSGFRPSVLPATGS